MISSGCRAGLHKRRCSCTTPWRIGRSRERIVLLGLAGPHPHPHPPPIGTGLGAFVGRAVGLVGGGSMLRWSITPYYMSLVSRDDSRRPPRWTGQISHDGNELTLEARARVRQTMAGAKTTTARLWLLIDSYPTASWLLVTDFSPSYCRDRTDFPCRARASRSSRSSGWSRRSSTSARRPRSATCWFSSGGDPLALSDERLDWVLTSLWGIQSGCGVCPCGMKTPASCRARHCSRG